MQPRPNRGACQQYFAYPLEQGLRQGSVGVVLRFADVF